MNRYFISVGITLQLSLAPFSQAQLSTLDRTTQNTCSAEIKDTVAKAKEEAKFEMQILRQVALQSIDAKTVGKRLVAAGAFSWLVGEGVKRAARYLALEKIEMEYGAERIGLDLLYQVLEESSTATGEYAAAVESFLSNVLLNNPRLDQLSKDLRELTDLKASLNQGGIGQNWGALRRQFQEKVGDLAQQECLATRASQKQAAEIVQRYRKYFDFHSPGRFVLKDVQSSAFQQMLAERDLLRRQIGIKVGEVLSNPALATKAEKELVVIATFLEQHISKDYLYVKSIAALGETVHEIAMEIAKLDPEFGALMQFNLEWNSLYIHRGFTNTDILSSGESNVAFRSWLRRQTELENRFYAFVDSKTGLTGESSLLLREGKEAVNQLESDYLDVFKSNRYASRPESILRFMKQHVKSEHIEAALKAVGEGNLAQKFVLQNVLSSTGRALLADVVRARSIMALGAGLKITGGALATVGGITFLAQTAFEMDGSKHPTPEQLTSQACTLVTDHHEVLLNLQSFSPYDWSGSREIDTPESRLKNFCLLVHRNPKCYYDAKNSLFTKDLPQKLAKEVLSAPYDAREDDTNTGIANFSISTPALDRLHVVREEDLQSSLELRQWLTRALAEAGRAYLLENH